MASSAAESFGVLAFDPLPEIASLAGTGTLQAAAVAAAVEMVPEVATVDHIPDPAAVRMTAPVAPATAVAAADSTAAIAVAAAVPAAAAAEGHEIATLAPGWLPIAVADLPDSAYSV